MTGSTAWTIGQKNDKRKTLVQTSHTFYVLCESFYSLVLPIAIPLHLKMQQTQQWCPPQILYPFSQVGFPVNLTWATSMPCYFLHFWNYSLQIVYLSFSTALLQWSWFCACSLAPLQLFHFQKALPSFLWKWIWSRYDADIAHMVHVNIVLSSQKMSRNRRDKSLHT